MTKCSLLAIKSSAKAPNVLYCMNLKAYTMRVLCILFSFIVTIQVFTDALHDGHDVSIEEVPYMAQTYKVLKDGVTFCGAVALSEKWFLSAAHCVRRNKGFMSIQMRVRTNKTLSGGNIYNISEIHVHKKYGQKTRWNSDLSLMKLEKAIQFDDKVRSILISKTAPKPGDVVTVTGYGNDYKVDYTRAFNPHVEALLGFYLKLGKQKVIRRNECREAYKNTPEKNIIIDDRTFCVESSTVDLCGGDSGSPAVLNGKVVGIAVEGCDAENKLPNIYVNVAHHFDWIVKTTGIHYE